MKQQSHQGSELDDRSDENIRLLEDVESAESLDSILPDFQLVVSRTSNNRNQNYENRENFDMEELFSREEFHRDRMFHAGLISFFCTIVSVFLIVEKSAPLLAITSSFLSISLAVVSVSDYRSLILARQTRSRRIQHEVTNDLENQQHRQPSASVQDRIDRLGFGIKLNLFPQVFNHEITSLLVLVTQPIIEVLKSDDFVSNAGDVISLLGHLFNQTPLNQKLINNIGQSSIQLLEQEVVKVLFENRLDYGPNFNSGSASPITEDSLLQIFTYAHLIGSLKKARMDSCKECDLSKVNLEGLTKKYQKLYDEFEKYCQEKKGEEGKWFAQELRPILNIFVASGKEITFDDARNFNLVETKNSNIQHRTNDVLSTSILNPEATAIEVRAEQKLP